MVSVGYGIPVGQPSRPSQPASARGVPVNGTPGRTYVGFTSPGIPALRPLPRVLTS